MGWTKEEFEMIDLGNQRLNQRAALLAERLGRKPGPLAADLMLVTANTHAFE